MVERIFHVKENQTTVRRELLAGLTTFMTMAYVVIVNPQILAESGMPVDGVLFATCISSAVVTLVMGIWELPDCPRSWNVVERSLHLFHCSWPRRAMEDSASMRNHVRNDRWRWRSFSSEREGGS